VELNGGLSQIDMPGSGQQLLNESQHRALSVRLAMLDQQIAEAEALLAGNTPVGRMFEIVPDIPADTTNELLRLFKQVRELVEKLRTQFNLKTRRVTTSQKLMGSFSILWTILEDSHADKLRGFGEVASELTSELDPKINIIIELINDIKGRVTAIEADSFTDGNDDTEASDVTRM
jgi:hypothetical protein